MDELRKSCAETKQTAEAALAVLSDLQDAFKFPKTKAEKDAHTTKTAEIAKNTKTTDNKTEKTDIKNTQNNVSNENTSKTMKKSTQRTTIIPHTPPVPVDVDPEKIVLEEHSLPGDLLGYKEHSEIFFAFSSTLVKVLQPSAVRTIHLKSCSESIARIEKTCREVRDGLTSIECFDFVALVLLCICLSLSLSSPPPPSSHSFIPPLPLSSLHPPIPLLVSFIPPSPPSSTLTLCFFHPSFSQVSSICDIFNRFTSPSADLDFETLLHTAVELCADKMHLLSRSFFLGVLYTFLPSLPTLIVKSMKDRGFPDVILTNPQVSWELCDDCSNIILSVFSCHILSLSFSLLIFSLDLALVLSFILLPITSLSSLS